MINRLPLVDSCTAGVLLGLVFFWVLWTTVKQLSRGRCTTGWMLGSFVLRFSLLLTEFYLLARYAGWEPVLSAAVGQRGIAAPPHRSMIAYRRFFHSLEEWLLPTPATSPPLLT